MAEGPWSGRKLTPGQVQQRLRTIGCTFVEEHIPGAETWRAPTGRHFSISLELCDAEYLEGIVRSVQEWVEAAKRD